MIQIRELFKKDELLAAVLFLSGTLPGRIARSAALFVGSTFSIWTNNHRAGSIFKNWRQVLTVFASGAF